MNFMLGEYDALPFGLLRHGKAGSTCGSVGGAPKFVHCCPDPGQKVMPLDKVREKFICCCFLQIQLRSDLYSVPPTKTSGGSNRHMRTQLRMVV